MASLNELEGDAVELVLIAVVIVIACLAFGLSKLDLAKFLKKLWNSLDSLFSSAVAALTNTGNVSGTGADRAYAGTNTMADYPNADGGQ